MVEIVMVLPCMLENTILVMVMLEPVRVEPTTTVPAFRLLPIRVENPIIPDVALDTVMVEKIAAFPCNVENPILLAERVEPTRVETPNDDV